MPNGRKIAVGVLALAVVGGIAAVVLDYRHFLLTPLPVAAERVLDLPKGDGLWQLAERLTAARLIPNPYYLVALAHWRRQAHQLKAGEYALTPGLTPTGLLDLLAAGRTVQHAIVIIEGWTLREALAAIARHPAYRSELLTASEAEIAQRLGLAEGTSPEGWIFPDTYRFSRGTSDTAVLRRAHRRMRDVLERAWAERAPDLPLRTPYEALILASIVEKETSRTEERALVAGVFTRRLRQGMRLQADPTVIYGLGTAYTGSLSRAELERDTPYNTYTRSGLPPTPIALPGAAALQAALHPAPGDWLYFVAKGDGSHYFSASLSEHQCAVRRYRRGEACTPRPERSAPPAAIIPPSAH